MIGVLLYGVAVGYVVYMVTCLAGAVCTFIVARNLRPYALRLLGKRLRMFEALDNAITQEGVCMALMWRVSPFAPFVLSSAILSITSISRWTYLWTTFVGTIPSTIPLLLGVSMGREVTRGDQVNPLMVALNSLGLIAALYIVIRLGKLSMSVFRRHGISSDYKSEDGQTGCQHEAAASEAAQVRPPRVVLL
eukprot:CAMPEP_0119312550 /NCGR_PEP_ID=MMETSP1333-20130426/26877_1 /TAXON_ID=418940 /ORGANISM="Scyphosphaera apsteinii, Strain RCC1455" /LENGTH=191 /DNA_ID=CAMNT_0007317191 /DNA_START=167 /DNA_END=742 /DNA_ORIENTATION=+